MAVREQGRPLGRPLGNPLALRNQSGGSRRVPTQPGTPFGGGLYAGRFKDPSGAVYALIVAPATLGQASHVQWKTTNTLTPGTFSNWDGASNTALMISAGGHDAAIACATAVIDGYSDWFLPARDQLEICYRNFKLLTTANFAMYDNGANPNAEPPTPPYTATDPAQTQIEAFRPGGAEAFLDSLYWTSTQHSAEWAYWDRFDTGQQSASAKTSSYAVRAVRQVKI